MNIWIFSILLCFILFQVITGELNDGEEIISTGEDNHNIVESVSEVIQSVSPEQNFDSSEIVQAKVEFSSEFKQSLPDTTVEEVVVVVQEQQVSGIASSEGGDEVMLGTKEEVTDEEDEIMPMITQLEATEDETIIQPTVVDSQEHEQVAPTRQEVSLECTEEEKVDSVEMVDTQDNIESTKETTEQSTSSHDEEPPKIDVDTKNSNESLIGLLGKVSKKGGPLCIDLNHHLSLLVQQFQSLKVKITKWVKQLSNQALIVLQNFKADATSFFYNCKRKFGY